MKDVLIKLVVDRSGSMQTRLADFQGGLDSFFAERAKVTGSVQYVSLDQFDTIHEIVYDFTKIEAAPKYRLVPRGGTALQDAIMAAISEVEAVPESRDSSIDKIVVILTDGLENSSVEHPGQAGATAVKQMITKKQELGWTFIYLGANQNSFEVAQTYGFRTEATMDFAMASSGAAMAAVSDNITRGSSGGSYSFTANERAASGGNN
jgi:Mg-chelatase subunit ChlD